MSRISSDEYYQRAYKAVLNQGSVGLVSKLIHKKLEAKAKGEVDSILELGAGSGQHLEFVNQKFNKYFETDIRLSNLPIRNSKSSGIIERLQLDAEKLTEIQDSSIDRLIVTCLLIHLSKPESALNEWRRVVKNGGSISFYVPCEPGLLLRFSRNISTVRKARKLGLNHMSFHYREHVTYFKRLDFLISEVFELDKIQKKYWPFRVHAWNLNFGSFYYIRVIK